MAPKKAGKREQAATAKSAPAPATKKARVEAKLEPKPEIKAKQEPKPETKAKAEPKPETKMAAKPTPKPKTETKFNPVIEGIMQSADLSDSCRQMLLTMIPHALGQPADERQHTQNVAVQLIGEALQEVAIGLQQELDERVAKLAEIDQMREDMLAKIKQLEAAAVQAATAEHDGKQELAEAVEQVAEAKAALLEKQELQRREDAVLDVAGSRKDMITEAFENHFKVIRDSELEGSVAKTHYEAMLPTINLLGLEESLTTALPSSCARSKGARGAFDCMVMEQLEKTIIDKLSELTNLLEIGSKARQERADAVKAAIDKLDAAQTLNKDRAEFFSAAQAALQNASNQVGAAQQSLQAHGPQRAEAAKAKQQKQDEFANFKIYNMGNYELLRDRVAKPPRALAAQRSQESAPLDAAEPAATTSPSEDIVMVEAVEPQAVVVEAPAEAESEKPTEPSVSEAADAADGADSQLTKAANEGDKQADVTQSKPDIAMQVIASEAPVTVGGA